MYFSKKMRGFYPSDLSDYEAANTLPDDLTPIGEGEHITLLAAQATGKVIDWSGDVPVAVDPLPPVRNVQAEIDQLERDSMTNRGARELQLELMREKGAANGLQTDAAIAAKVPYFAKLLALDVQIRALRAQL